MASSQGAPSQAPSPREIWRLGNYAKMAEETIGKLGEDLVRAAGITSGQRVLDVAAGAGNSSIPAAHKGASVTALDITPELLEAGRARAEREGLEISWREGDAQDLPFADGEFDVVISSIGAMFAPDHQKTADELLRVCKPGGTVAMANWTATGTVQGFFQSLSRYAPEPPPGWKSPLMWGDPGYVTDLFGDRIDSLEVTEESVLLDRFESVEDMLAYYRENFGPAIAAFAAVADDPAKVKQLEQDYLDFTRSADVSKGEGRPCLDLAYNIFVGRKRSV